MKVIYKQQTTSSLTENKVYDVITLTPDTYQILDDTGMKMLFSSSRFKLLSDVRAEKLKQLV